MKLLTKIKRAIGRNMLFAFRWVFSKLPYWAYKVLSILIIPLAHCIMLAKRKVVMESLAIAYGNELSLKERKRIAKLCFRTFAYGMLDLIYFLDHREALREHIEFEGREHLDKVLAEGKGAVVLSAHCGNFISMYLRFIQEGYKTNVVMRRTRDSQFEDYITKFRNANGIQTVYSDPQRKCVGQALKALRDNELLFILLDQNYGRSGGVFVDFFGKKAATATGPLIFSNRTNAPIIPIFIKSIGKGRHKIVIEPPVEIIKSDSEEALVENVSRLTRVIENFIRKVPHEWGGWMHQRWKTEYKGEPISK